MLTRTYGVRTYMDADFVIWIYYSALVCTLDYILNLTLFTLNYMH
jgi:hypothetical protein